MSNVVLEVKKSAAPWLHEVIGNVDEETQKCKTIKDLNDKCPVRARGCLKAIDMMIERFMQFAASSMDSHALDDICL